jgi:hypothetical protein
MSMAGHWTQRKSRCTFIDSGWSLGMKGFGIDNKRPLAFDSLNTCVVSPGGPLRGL